MAIWRRIPDPVRKEVYALLMTEIRRQEERAVKTSLLGSLQPGWPHNEWGDKYKASQMSHDALYAALARLQADEF